MICSPSRAWNWITLVVVGVALVLVSCAPAAYQKRESLSEQILTPYPGKQGLVYRHCGKYDRDGKCVDEDLTVYDLADGQVRRRLLLAGVACWVGRDVYVPCEADNGLCYRALGKRPVLGIIGKKPVIEKRLYFGIEGDVQAMIDARTVCGTIEALERFRGVR